MTLLFSAVLRVYSIKVILKMIICVLHQCKHFTERCYLQFLTATCGLSLPLLLSTVAVQTLQFQCTLCQVHEKRLSWTTAVTLWHMKPDCSHSPPLARGMPSCVPTLYFSFTFICCWLFSPCTSSDWLRLPHALLLINWGSCSKFLHSNSLRFPATTANHK